jgi:nicotinate-nucleotide pyrophosphorylase (carboxylating)
MRIIQSRAEEWRWVMDRSVRQFIKSAIDEDVGHGDVTSRLIIRDQTAVAGITAKEDFVLAGMPFVSAVFDIIDPKIVIEINFSEGARVKNGDVIASLTGSAASLLMGERTALNILQRLSGIATMTSGFADRVKELPVRIVDTRKTAPGMRIMEKYAVTTGGGYNHRFGLYDGVLIKDNHINIAGGIAEAVYMAKKAQHLLKIEVEVGNIDEMKQAIEAGADVVMLDNMSVGDMKQAVALARSINAGVLLEASGNVTLDSVRSIAETGVDIISVGAITHSARAVDISMKMK